MHFNYRCLFVVLSFFCFTPVKAQSTTSTVQQIQQSVKNNAAAQLTLLKTLVNINSGTTNINGVHQTGLLLQSEFEKLGFKTYWKEEPADMQRAGTLIAEHKGSKGQTILLIGHLDTVFAANSPFQHFSRHDNIATGPGIGDDKGGDVVILYALKALQAAHALNDRNITVVLTGDEEDSGKPSSISRKPLIDAAQNANMALEFECALTPSSATIARRGISDWLINTTGQTGHSSNIFGEGVGDGAIYEMTRILDSIRVTLSKEPHITISPGLILGGTQVSFDNNNSEGNASGKANVIAAHATAEGDLRYLSEAQKISAKNTITQIVNQHLPTTSATIDFQDGIPAMSPSAGNEQLLTEYSKVSELLGYGNIIADDPDTRGASDIAYVASIVPANLAGLGPVCQHPHSPSESIDINTLLPATERAALLILQQTNL